MKPYSILRKKHRMTKKKKKNCFQKIEPGEFFSKVETDQPASRVRTQPLYTTFITKSVLPPYLTHAQYSRMRSPIPIVPVT